MQPQGPYNPDNPAPPQPSVPPSMSHNPKNYTAPDFGHGHNTTVPPTPQNQDYSFIFESSQQPTKRSILSGTTGPMIKVILGLCGLFVLLILFVVIKGIFSSTGSNATAILAVIEDQQAMYHIANEASGEQGLLSQTLNSAITTEVTISSAQSQLEVYYHKAGLVKYNPTVLISKISKSTDNQLNNATGSGLYDQTYVVIMQGWFDRYEADLKAAYNLTSDKTGRTILRADYSGATLLLQQLNAPSG